jgi:repressor LexA
MDFSDKNTSKSTKKREIRLEIGNRLTDFYTKKGLKRKEFAESLGWEYDTLRSYEDGRAEPGGDFFQKLVEVYPDANITYLVTGIKSGGLTLAPIKEIPLVNEVQAGLLNFHFRDEDIIGVAYTGNTTDKDLFALRVVGDSMEPEISEGDIATCAPHKPFVNGKLYIVVTGDSEATIKQVWRKENGYSLIARNPEYPNVFLPDSKIERLIRVIEIAKKL